MFGSLVALLLKSNLQTCVRWNYRLSRQQPQTPLTLESALKLVKVIMAEWDIYKTASEEGIIFKGPFPTDMGHKLPSNCTLKIRGWLLLSFH